MPLLSQKLLLNNIPLNSQVSNYCQETQTSQSSIRKETMEYRKSLFKTLERKHKTIKHKITGLPLAQYM